MPRASNSRIGSRTRDQAASIGSRLTFHRHHADDAVACPDRTGEAMNSPGMPVVSPTP